MRQGEGQEGTPSRLPALWDKFWASRRFPVAEHRVNSRLVNLQGTGKDTLSFLSKLFFVCFHVMWKKFTVARVRDTAKMNLESRIAKFRAEVNDLNASAALDWGTVHYTDHESRNRYPAISMLNAIRLDRSVGWSRQEPPTRDTHWCVASLKFREADNFIPEFNFEAHGSRCSD